LPEGEVLLDVTLDAQRRCLAVLLINPIPDETPLLHLIIIPFDGSGMKEANRSMLFKYEPLHEFASKGDKMTFMSEDFILRVVENSGDIIILPSRRLSLSQFQYLLIPSRLDDGKVYFVSQNTTSYFPSILVCTDELTKETLNLEVVSSNLPWTPLDYDLVDILSYNDSVLLAYTTSPLWGNRKTSVQTVHVYSCPSPTTKDDSSCSPVLFAHTGCTDHNTMSSLHYLQIVPVPKRARIRTDSSPPNHGEYWLYVVTTCSVVRYLHCVNDCHMNSSTEVFPLRTILVNSVFKMQANAFGLAGLVTSSASPHSLVLFELLAIFKIPRFYLSTTYTLHDALILFNDQDPENDLILAINPSTLLSSTPNFTLFRYQSEMVITSFANLKCIESMANLSVRLLGETSQGIKTYQFNFFVLCKPYSTIWNINLGEQWVYSNLMLEGKTSPNTLYTKLPLDTFNSLMADVELSTNPYKSRVSVSTDRPQPIENTNTFVYPSTNLDLVTEHSNFQRANSKTIIARQYGHFILQMHFDESLTLMRCGIRLQTADPRGFSCRVIFEQNAYIDGIDFQFLEFLTLHNNTAKQYVTYVVTRSTSIKSDTIKVYKFIDHLFETYNSYDLESFIVFSGKLAVVDNKLHLMMMLASPSSRDSSTDVYLQAISWNINNLALVQRLSPNAAPLRTVTEPHLFQLFSFDDGDLALILFPNSLTLAYTMTAIRMRVDTFHPFAFTVSSVQVIDSTSTNIIIMLRNRLIDFSVDSTDIRSHSVQGDSQETYTAVLPLPSVLTEGAGFGYEPIIYKQYEGILLLVYKRGEEEGLVVVYDLRWKSEHPLKRLLYSEIMTIYFDDLGENPNANAHMFITREIASLHIVFFESTRVLRLSISLYGSDYLLALRPSDLNSIVSTIDVKASTQKDTESTSVSMNIIKTSYDPLLELKLQSPSSITLSFKPKYEQISTSSNYKLVYTKSIGELVAWSGPIARFSLASDNKEALKGISVSSYLRPVQLSLKWYIPLELNDTDADFNVHRSRWVRTSPPFISGRDAVRLNFDTTILIKGAKNFSVWRTNGTTRMMNILKEEFAEEVVWGFVNHETRLQYKILSSGNLVFVMAIFRGTYAKNNFRFYIIDSENPLNRAYETLFEVCDCDKARFELTGRVEDGFNLALYYNRNTYNGTTWVASRLVIVPKHRDKTVLHGFKFIGPTDITSHTFRNKPVEVATYGLLKPTSDTTMQYFFLQNSGEMGLFYLGPNTIKFTYHTYSSTCINKEDTRVSCYIHEQDLEINCLAQCDRTKVDRFKLRFDADEIYRSNMTDNSNSRGVTIIHTEPYKIPEDYSVLNIVKGVSFDVMVVAHERVGMDTAEYALIYDHQKGDIVNRIPAAELCDTSINSACLREMFIYTMSATRVLFLQKNKPLDSSLYLKEGYQLELDYEPKITRSFLKGVRLVGEGLELKTWNPDKKQVELVDIRTEINLDSAIDLDVTIWSSISEYYLLFILLVILFGSAACCLLLYGVWGTEKAYNYKEPLGKRQDEFLNQIDHSIMDNSSVNIKSALSKINDKNAVREGKNINSS
jgi:hypothetical protein